MYRGHARLCVCVCKRPQCGPLRRYKDTVNVNMKRCGLQSKSLSTAVLDRAQWRTTCQSVIAAFEETRVAELDRKRAARKQQAINITGTAWPCDRCNKICSSRIGWDLRPSAYPSVTQSVDIDGALYVSVHGRMPTLLHGPVCKLGSGRGCPLVVHYWADLQSVHGLRGYGNTMEMRGRAQR